MRAALLILTASVVLVGCAATGTQVSSSAAVQFTEGKSTEADVVAKLGQPQSVVTQAGARTLIYAGSQYSIKPASFIPIVGLFAGGANYAYSQAIYRFRGDGVLESITHTQGGNTSANGAQPAPAVQQEPTAIK